MIRKIVTPGEFLMAGGTLVVPERKVCSVYFNSVTLSLCIDSVSVLQSQSVTVTL